MTEIALTTIILVCVTDILKNIIENNGSSYNSYDTTTHGIKIVIDIAWIFICAVALFIGGGFTSATISVATIFIILEVISGICYISMLGKAAHISHAIELAIDLVLLIMLLSI